MKKKNLNKKLSLGKKQISKLDNVKGGVSTVDDCTTKFTDDPGVCTTSALVTECNCEPSWQTNCVSIQIECAYTEQPGCVKLTVQICF
ncbi:MAG: hypothetical protein AAF617_01315 [Bacteroidota bacterium]